MLKLRSLLTSCAVLAVTLSAAAQGQWQVTNTFHLGGDGGWDYVTVDSATHRVFVTRSTHTIVFDGTSGKMLGDIPGQVRSHGVALVPKLNRGFITDGGGSGAILIFDMKTYKVLGKIATMPDSDGIIYDAGTNRILAVSGDEGKLMSFDPSIDPANGKMDPPIVLGGSPEFLAADGKGKVFVNLEDKDLVAEVDLHSREVIARWPTAPTGHPTGMAIDQAHHLIFVGGRKPQQMIAIDTQTGKVVSSVAIGAGVDADGFYNGEAFASCGDGTLTVAAEQGGKLAVKQVVKTVPSARTMGIDTAAQTIYLPAAEMEPPATPGARPRPKPGTFEIVVLTRR